MGIALSYADYKTINAHQGYSLGFNSDIMKINNLEVELLQKFEKHLCKSKGVLINFIINENKSLSDISSAIVKINHFINNDTNIIVGTETNSSINTEECKFEILITGLETI